MRHGGNDVNRSAARVPFGAGSAFDRSAVSDKAATFSPAQDVDPDGAFERAYAEAAGVQLTLEDQLERAERDLVCADYTDDTQKMLREKADARQRIASLKRQIAERNESQHVAAAVALMDDRHAG